MRKSEILSLKWDNVNLKNGFIRHTYASHLVMGGVDLATVKELLGHKDIKMTLRYSHLAPSHKAKAIETLEAVLSGKSTSQKLHIFEVAR